MPLAATAMPDPASGDPAKYVPGAPTALILGEPTTLEPSNLEPTSAAAGETALPETLDEIGLVLWSPKGVDII